MCCHGRERLYHSASVVHIAENVTDLIRQRKHTGNKRFIAFQDLIQQIDRGNSRIAVCNYHSD